MATVITETELIEALSVAMKASGPTEAMTVAELQAATRLGEKRLRRALHALKRDQRLVVHQVVRETLDNRPCVVSAYTIRAAPRKR